jgi:hypothetical protein
VRGPPTCCVRSPSTDQRASALELQAAYEDQASDPLGPHRGHRQRRCRRNPARSGGHGGVDRRDGDAGVGRDRVDRSRRGFGRTRCQRARAAAATTASRASAVISSSRPGTDSRGQAKVAMSLPCDGLAMVLSPCIRRFAGFPPLPVGKQPGKYGAKRALCRVLATERRWNRTIQAEGCSALPVLKTSSRLPRLWALAAVMRPGIGAPRWFCDRRGVSGVLGRPYARA